MGSAIGEYLAKIRESSPLMYYMTIALITSLVVFLLIGVATSWQSVYDALYRDKNDIFMDYFNSIYYSWSGKPYTEFTVIYPPLITAFYGFIATFINVEIDFTDGFGIRDTYVGLFSYMIFAMIAVLLMHTILKHTLKNQDQQILVDVLIISVLLSYPMVFAIMRGNSIVYSAIFVSLFVLGYRSNNTIIRYCSYICLGIATGIKIFPAFLWILTLSRKDYKESFKAFLIIIALLFIPFIFTDGTPISFITYAFSYTSGVDTITAICNTRDIIYLLTYAGIPDIVLKLLSTAVIVLQYLSVLIVLLVFKNIKKWEIITLCILAVCLGFGTSVSYTPVYLILCIALFLKEEKDLTFYNKMVAALFVAIMVVIPGFMDSLGRNLMMSIHGVAMVGLFYLLLWKVINRNKEKQQEKSEETSEGLQ